MCGRDVGKGSQRQTKKKILRREESGLQSELYQSEAQSGERGRRWRISWRWRRACRLVLHVWGDRRRKHHCPASHHQHGDRDEGQVLLITSHQECNTRPGILLNLASLGSWLGSPGKTHWQLTSWYTG